MAAEGKKRDFAGYTNAEMKNVARYWAKKMRSDERLWDDDRLTLAAVLERMSR